MEQLSAIISHWADIIPLELYVVAGSFVEEIVAPIPSPVILTLGGSIARAQGHTWLYLLVLSFLADIGKTAAAWVLYGLADRLEDIVIGRFGRFIGIKQHDIEHIGERFHKGHRDVYMLAALRAIPIIPSAVLSVVCGAIKLDLRTYLVATLVGTFFRNLIFLYFGFFGAASYTSLMRGMDEAESLVQVGILAGLILLIAAVYYRRHTHRRHKRQQHP